MSTPRSLLALSACSFLLTACDTGSPLEGLPTSELSAEAGADGGAYRGDVRVIPQSGSSNVVIAVDVRSTTGGSDGRADHFYVLQRPDGAAHVEPRTLRDATLQHHSHSLLVWPKGEEAVLAFVVRNNDAPHPSAIPVAKRQVWMGFGLARMGGEQIATLGSLTPSNLTGFLPVCGGIRNIIPRLTTAPEEEALSCDAGGRGSTTCSVDCASGTVGKACSVGCGTGYHSCCDTLRCKCQCVRN